MTNTLYYGDNLDILRQHVPDESVDLVYLDPPFNSNANYTCCSRSSPRGITRPDQGLHRHLGVDPGGRAHLRTGDHHQPGHARQRQGHDLSLLPVHRQQRDDGLPGDDDASAVELRRVLKPTGSIYLHCDPTASHYLKLLMDSVLGVTNFQTEITWKRTSSHNDSKRFGQVKDTILFYSKTSDRTWNRVNVPHDESYVSSFYRHEDERGKYRLHEISRTASMGPRPNLSYEYKNYTPELGMADGAEKLEALDSDD